MTQQHASNNAQPQLREWSGTYGGFYLLPGDAWGVSTAPDGSPQARCCSCSWEHDAANEEESVRMLTAHLRVAHPDQPGVVNPSDRPSDET